MFFRSSVIIAHLDRHPVNGGRPSRERRIREVMISMVSILFHISDMELVDINE